jgi:hypothetical protein
MIDSEIEAQALGGVWRAYNEWMIREQK